MTLIILGALLLLVLLTLFSRQPEGTNLDTQAYPASGVEFITDLSYQKDGAYVHELNIFQEQLDMIAAAERFVVMDVFLFNDSYDRTVFDFPDNTKALTDALLAKRALNPEVELFFLTDPINTFYGDGATPALDTLRENGVNVTLTDLDKLRDSNLLYSGFYQVFSPALNLMTHRWITNPLEPFGEPLSIRAVSRLANFKANHRKLLLTDQAGLITSANPHDASGFHSNVALKFESPVINDMLRGENAIAKFSGGAVIDAEWSKAIQPSDTTIRYVTEKAILKSLLGMIDSAREGDSLDMGIFYISEPAIIESLENAAARGVSIRIIADANKGAFGMKRDGTPNRVVLTQLVKAAPSIAVKWYNTSIEQYHSKFSRLTSGDRTTVILGSANYTRRNLQNYNLECDIVVECEAASALAGDISAYFDRLWENRDGEYTLPFDAYKDESTLRYLRHLAQEALGLCTY